MILEFYQGMGCGIAIGVFIMWLFILIKEQQKNRGWYGWTKKQEDGE